MKSEDTTQHWGDSRLTLPLARTTNSRSSRHCMTSLEHETFTAKVQVRLEWACITI